MNIGAINITLVYDNIISRVLSGYVIFVHSVFLVSVMQYFIFIECCLGSVT